MTENLYKLREEKERMESKIFRAVSEIVRDFEKATGFSPTSIDIPLISIQSINTKAQAKLGKVTTEINLFD